MSKRARVSVVLATHNGSVTVAAAIGSILNQTLKDCELIVVDDCSSDDTPDVVRKIKDRRIVYTRNERNLGYAGALSRGLRRAQGDYISIIDDDDVWLDKDKLKKQATFLDARPDYALVGGGVVTVDESGAELSRRLMPETDAEIRERMLMENPFIHSSIMYRREAAINAGGYRQSRCPYSEDYDLWVKLGTAGKLANLPAYVVRYTTRERGAGYALRMRIIPAVRSLALVAGYRNHYPHCRQALRRRCREIANLVVHAAWDTPPLCNIKIYIKDRHPACWRLVKLGHRAIFRGC